MKEREPLGINLGEKISQTLAKKQREMDDIAQKNILEQGGKRLAEEARAALEINDFALAEAKIAELKNLLLPADKIADTKLKDPPEQKFFDSAGNEIKFNTITAIKGLRVGDEVQDKYLKGMFYKIVGFSSENGEMVVWLQSNMSKNLFNIKESRWYEIEVVERAKKH